MPVGPSWSRISISNANSQGNNHISVTHKLAVQPEVQPHCFGEEYVGSNLKKGGKLEKVQPDQCIVSVPSTPEL